MKSTSLVYTPITKDNLALIVRLQAEIFPGESAKLNYMETLSQDRSTRILQDWIVSAQGKPIGIVGHYTYKEYPNVAWLGWFGVLETERGKGYGSKIFDFWIHYATEQGYTEARLYTDTLQNAAAVEFYTRKGLQQEPYSNDQENTNVIKNFVIFSRSLTKSPIELWNNKYLALTEQVNKENLSTTI